jgi:hypothetical protein
MPEIVAEAVKFAGISQERARSFPRRTLIGADMNEAQIAAMPKMISKPFNNH